MLKKILQSKTAKTLFRVAFWGGNLMICVIMSISSLSLFLKKPIYLFSNVSIEILEVLACIFLLLAIIDVLVFVNFFLNLTFFKKKNEKTFKRKTFIMVGVLIVIFLSLYRLALLKQAPDLSVEEYFKCTTGVIKQYYPFVISKTGVCVEERECSSLSSIINCKDLDDPQGGWKVAKGLSKNNFDFEFVCIDEENNTIVYDYNRKRGINEKGYAMMYSENTATEDSMSNTSCSSVAWFLNIGDKTYFWWPFKGNGRLLEIDKETFRYLGHDRYEDKNGLIIKKTRVSK